mgnify:CR=1 FL=1
MMFKKTPLYDRIVLSIPQIKRSKKMKRLIHISIFLFVLLAAVSGCSSGTAKNAAPAVVIENGAAPLEKYAGLDAGPGLSDYSSYTINMEIDTVSGNIIAIEKVKLRNQSEENMPYIAFNVYANALSEGSNAYVFLPGEEKDFYSYGKKYASFEISNVRINGNEAPFELSGTIFKITPEKPIAPGAESEIVFQFKAEIPKTSGRMGGNQSALWFGNFIPTLGVFKDGKWINNTCTPFNKAFFTSAATYDVTITAPKDYVVVAPGIEKTSAEGNNVKSNFKTSLIRGFSFAASNLYEKSSITSKSGVAINLYSYSGAKNKNLLLGNIKRDFDFYYENIGTYPYQSLNIAECELFDGNPINYPQVIFANSQDFKTYGESLDLSSQWFGMLASVDPGNQGWLYNGINKTVKGIRYYSESRLSEKVAADYDYLLGKLEGGKLSMLGMGLYSYTSREDYSDIEVVKSSLMMYEFYKTVGKDMFFEILKNYYSRYAFKNSDVKDFIGVCNEISGENYMPFFNYWIESDSLPSVTTDIYKNSD